MRKASNKDDGGEVSSNAYERSRQLRIKENNTRLQELGLRDLAASLTNQRVKNKKQKLLASSDDAATYVHNLENVGDDSNDEGSSTDVRGQRPVKVYLLYSYYYT